ncbi:MAG: serine phosphatase RsbU, regulator of sigma subunit [Bacteroidetes bacterium]|nr:serine phosphatase RsbU, regulator of sigma subunit [Bacteroidota bacterium]
MLRPGKSCTHFFYRFRLLALIVCLFPAAALAVDLDKQKGSLDLVPVLEIYEDRSGNQDIQDVFNSSSFKACTQDVPNYSITSSAVWIRFNVTSMEAGQWYLALYKSRIDTVELYQVFNGVPQLIKTGGKALPENAKEVRTNDCLFSLFLPPGSEQQFYVRFKSKETLELPLKLVTADTYIRQLHAISLLDGIYFGFIILICLYNLGIYIGVKDRIYIFYILYVFFIGIMIAQFKGEGSEFLWRNFTSFNNYPSLFPALASIFGMLFTIHFLNVRNDFKIFYRIFISLIVVNVACMFINFAGLASFALKIIQVLSLITSILMFVTGIKSYRLGFAPARYYLLAWSAFLLGVVVYILKDLNVIAYTPLTSNAIQIGSAFEITLLSLALADRINVYRKEKQEAQSQAVLALQMNERLIIEQNKTLEEKVKLRTLELESKNVIIQTKNTELTDSIRYAKRIQDAILPDQNYLSKIFPGAFILFKPKDIVSGDIYWIEQWGNEVVVAAIDCTGHGVPGAFMTFMAHNLLNEIVNEHGITKPSVILTQMRTNLSKVLRQKNSEQSIKDGMDVSVCTIHMDTMKLEFAGAFNPLFIARKGEFIKLAADRCAVSAYEGEELPPFSNQEMQLEQGDRLYLFSDGYADQFGGPQGKKMTIRKFKELILSICNKPAEEQKALAEDYFESWKKENEQTDDVLVIGICID